MFDVFNRLFIIFALLLRPADSFLINPVIKRNFYLEKSSDRRETIIIKRTDPTKIFLLKHFTVFLLTFQITFIG